MDLPFQEDHYCNRCNTISEGERALAIVASVRKLLSMWLRKKAATERAFGPVSRDVEVMIAQLQVLLEDEKKGE